MKLDSQDLIVLRGSAMKMDSVPVMGSDVALILIHVGVSLFQL